jgi:phosphoribosylaminoimidazolecarboxamide formyltransferase / IMP cyclohydrolase
MEFLTGVESKQLDVIQPKRVLITVFDKFGVVEIARFLSNSLGCEILSTGGTAKTLREAGLYVTDVSDYTKSPEILSGRVKTLHPAIHGGLLAAYGNAEHEKDMNREGIKTIDMVVTNLYPFNEAVRSNAAFDDCIENIDIGGNSLLRSGAKNYNRVAVLSSPSQYKQVMSELQETGGTSLSLRRYLAASAFALCATYDATISAHFTSQLSSDSGVPGTDLVHHDTPSRDPDLVLKYGCNPHQSPAAVYRPVGSPDCGLPFEALNGTPGYINLLDALNAWQLVKELRHALDMPSAASFKHCSPAGAAIGLPLSDIEQEIYAVNDRELPLSPLAVAYVRARNADPLCSFGDFVALSDKVDVSTAMVLKTEVCDGCIAPAYDSEALVILKQKKKGNFIILQMDPEYVPGEQEFREVFGIGMKQRRNDVKISIDSLSNVVCGKQDIPFSAKRDMVLASIVLKYTQSNSVGYALNGQMIGVGAGQQSRVDCVKLAGKKSSTWWCRHHPKVRKLLFKSSVKRQEQINARVSYIEGELTAAERVHFLDLFEEAPPSELTNEEKTSFMNELKGVSISSDAFFPFRDSIDHASKVGVQFVAQPGGSVADEDIKAACIEYGMSMAFTSIRLFHH